MLKKKKMCFTILIVFLITAILPVYADELDDKRQELNSVNHQLNQQQQQLKETQKTEKTIISQIEALEKDISKTEQDLAETTSRINNLEAKIEVVQKDIDKKEKDLADKSKLLGERLVYIFEDGDISYLEVLLSSSNLNDFLTRYEMLNVLVASDMDLIETVKKERAELEMTKSDLEVSARELENALTSQKNMKASLDTSKAEKQKMLSSVQAEKEKYLEAVNELESNSRELEQMIRRAQSGGNSSGVVGTGVYTWPTPGYSSITSPYGMRFHPILKERKLHTGVDIGAPNNASIVAADGGTVILSGWNGGYGQTIVIDHGNGMSTLYAHQSTLIARVGDNVSKGDLIGKVGSTGWSTGPHLHFEVRINGTPTDPMAYL